MSTVPQSFNSGDEWRVKLQAMTVEEKIDLMSLIWSEIAAQPENYQSPAWHEEVLNERQKEIDEGRAQYRDWEVVKRELRERFYNR